MTSVRLLLSRGYLADYISETKLWKLFGGMLLRGLHHLEVCDETPLPYRFRNALLDYVFDFSRLQKPEKFVRIDGTIFSEEFKWKLTRLMSEANEKVAFVSASVPCYRREDNSDKLNDVFVEERSQATSVVAPNGRKVSTIRQGNSFIVTNDIAWLQQKLPGLSFAS